MLMDVLEHLLPTPSTRRARRLAERGEEAIGVIDGIRVGRRGDALDRWDYAIQVGSERLGVRQSLLPQRERAHLGAQVVVRRSGDQAIIDWPGTLARAGSAAARTGAALQGWKPLSKVPVPGIEDTDFRPPNGAPASVVIATAERTSAGFGMLADWDLEVLDGEQRRELGRERVPAWAVHLLVPGVTLGACRDGENIRIDWVQSAEQLRGRAPAFDFDARLPGAEAAEDESDLDLEAFNAEFEAWKQPKP